MARTLRTSYDHRSRSARDGSVRNWEARGRRTRGEVAAHRAARQAARRDIEAQLEEVAAEAASRQAELEAQARNDAMDIHEREYAQFLREMEEERVRLAEAGDWEGLYEFDNPAYAKWKERQLFAA